MIRDKKIVLLLLKQVLWGVRRGETNNGICGLFSRLAVKIVNRAERHDVTVNLFTLTSIKKTTMAKAASQLGWEYNELFPVPRADGSRDTDGIAFHQDRREDTFWKGQRGMYRSNLLARMIWILKAEIYMERDK